jgi:replication factor A1
MKVRVTQKSDIRTWHNQRGEGKLFSAIFMDDTGEIKATAFNQAVDELYDKLQEGKVYFITRCRAQLAKKKFSHLSNDYEINLESYTEIEEVELFFLHYGFTHIRRKCLDNTDVPEVKYNFVKLGDLQNVEKDGVCGGSFLLYFRCLLQPYFTD